MLQRKDQVWRLSTQEGCQFEWHHWWTCGCTLASVTVSAIAITCAALSIENECRINPLKKTKGPWLWVYFQRACVPARRDGSSIFLWQVKPPKPHHEPKLWHRRAAAAAVRTNKKAESIRTFHRHLQPGLLVPCHHPFNNPRGMSCSSQVAYLQSLSTRWEVNKEIRRKRKTLKKRSKGRGKKRFP